MLIHCPPLDEPPQLPVSILDMKRSGACFNMDLHMQDPCPKCGGFRMSVGDWVCWGFCYVCYSNTIED